MNASVPFIGRVTFVIHFLAALVFGLGLLFIPETLGAAIGFSGAAIPVELDPVLRSFGALILGLGGVTSLYGIVTKSWTRMDYIVRGEITYLALATILFLVFLIMGRGAAQANLILTIVSVVLLILFVLTWVSRPKA